MRVLALVGVACLALPSALIASPQVSPTDAEMMRTEALQNTAPDRMKGNTGRLREDTPAPIDGTTGRNVGDPDDCSRVPVWLKRSDGKIVTNFANVCD